MTSQKRRRGGFLLLETMMGVAIFALAMLALARALNHCMEAQRARRADAEVRTVLANRMAEIEAGAVALDAHEDAGAARGVTLSQRCGPVRLWNEQGGELYGVVEVHLEARWREAGAGQSKELVFYVLQKR